jgi:integrase
MKGRVTDEAASTLPKNQVLWDDLDPGFGVRRQREIAVFIVRYRQNGVRRHITLGRQPELTAAEARSKAKIILDAARRQETSEVPWEIPRSKSGAVYFGEIAERYLHEFAKPRKKPSSVLADQRNLELHVLPALGHLRLSRIDRSCIAKMHASQCSAPVAANRCLALVSHIFTVAEKWGLLARGANPCRGIDRFRERPRERYLTDEELQRLGQALRTCAIGYAGIDWATYSIPVQFARETAEDWRAIAAIQLLLLTGARMTEVLSLRWSWIDSRLGIARLPDSKTGPKLLYLPEHAMLVLGELRKRVTKEYPNSPFVLPGNRPSTCFQGLFHPWSRIRFLAGLHDLRIHDLRHVYASTAVSEGDSLYIVGRILGHRQLSTTERYAHLAIGPVREVANRTAAKLARFL